MLARDPGAREAKRSTDGKKERKDFPGFKVGELAPLAGLGTLAPNFSKNSIA